MTDARTDALTAPTADPGIVAALVYVGDQIAATAAGRASNRLLTDDGAEHEPVDTPAHEALYQLRALCLNGEAREIRESNLLSVAEVAQAVNVSHTAVSRWERGLRVPRGAAALRYAKLLSALGRNSSQDAEKEGAS